MPELSAWNALQNTPRGYRSTSPSVPDQKREQNGLQVFPCSAAWLSQKSPVPEVFPKCSRNTSASSVPVFPPLYKAGTAEHMQIDTPERAPQKPAPWPTAHATSESQKTVARDRDPRTRTREAGQSSAHSVPVRHFKLSSLERAVRPAAARDLANVQHGRPHTRRASERLERNPAPAAIYQGESMRPDRDDPDVTHHDVSKLLRSTGAPSTGWWAVYRNPKTQQLWWNEVAGWAEVQRGSYSYNRKTHENSPVEWIDSRERDVPGVFVAGLVREYGLPSLVPVEEMYAQYEFTTYVFDPERKPDVASWIGSDEADERAAVEAA